MEDEKIFEKIDERQEALDKFKLEVLSTFEDELEALLHGMKNEDKIRVNFDLSVLNAADMNNRYDANISRRSDRTMALVNPKTLADLKPVEEDNQNGTEL